jgi:hypothetical protein
MSIRANFDLDALRIAQAELMRLETALIERARMILLATKGDRFENFVNDRGYSVRVGTYSVLDEASTEVRFTWTDEQGRGNPQTVTVDKEALLGDPTEEEKEFEEYTRLKAKYEKR